MLNIWTYCETNTGAGSDISGISAGSLPLYVILPSTEMVNYIMFKSTMANGTQGEEKVEALHSSGRVEGMGYQR